MYFCTFSCSGAVFVQQYLYFHSSNEVVFVRLCLDLHVYYKYSIFLIYSRDVRVIEKQGLSALCLACVCVVCPL